MRRRSVAMAGERYIALLVLMWCGAMEAKAAPPMADCSTPFNDLMPCIEFVNSNSSAPPNAACCTAFSTTLKQRPECLCQLQQAFADPATAPGNATRAGQIPTLCNVAVDYSKCPALLGLAPAPAPQHTSPPPLAAPGPAPRTGQDVDCTSSINELSPCLGFVSGDGKGAPPHDCCTAIGSVQSHEPVCICQLVAQASNGAQYGINATLAQRLPALCHVAANTSQCPALLNSPLAPVPAPVHAPVPAPPSPIASQSPDQSVDCSNEYALLQSCFAYVMANDTAPPSAECCTAFGSVVASKPVCLCQLLQTVGSGDPATTGINATRALQLPTVCKVAIDVGRCPALLGQPVSSPLPSTGDAPGSISSPISSPSGVAPTLSTPSAASSSLLPAPFAALLWSFALSQILLKFC